MKTQLLEGFANVIKRDSGCVGNMSWETSYIEIEFEGIIYTYQSDESQNLPIPWDLYENHIESTPVWVKMRVRSNNHVQRMIKIKYVGTKEITFNERQIKKYS